MPDFEENLRKLNLLEDPEYKKISVAAAESFKKFIEDSKATMMAMQKKMQE